MTPLPDETVVPIKLISRVAAIYNPDADEGEAPTAAPPARPVSEAAGDGTAAGAPPPVVQARWLKLRRPAATLSEVSLFCDAAASFADGIRFSELPRFLNGGIREGSPYPIQMGLPVLGSI